MLKIVLKASWETRFTLQFHLKHAEYLTLEDGQDIASILIDLYGWGHSSKTTRWGKPILTEGQTTLNAPDLANSAMYRFLDLNDVHSFNENAKRAFYNLLRPLIGNKKKEQKYQYLKDLIERHPHKVTYLIESMPFNTSDNNISSFSTTYLLSVFASQ